MSGLFTVYYTIKPTDELNQLILQADKKIRMDYSWLKPRIWFSEESLYGDVAYLTNLVKIAFLLEIIRYRDWASENIIELVFGKPPQFSISTFDRWWEIERFEAGAETWKVVMKAKAEDIRLIQLTGDNFIDKWLRDTIQYKEATDS